MVSVEIQPALTVWAVITKKSRRIDSCVEYPVLRKLGRQGQFDGKGNRRCRLQQWPQGV
jgi:hypothetical protein